MIYIIEGIDRAGKSTLAKLLSSYLKCKIWHDEYKPFYIKAKEVDEYYLHQVMETKFMTLLQMFGLFDNLIVDRCHLTEKVYNVMRGQNFNWLEFDSLLKLIPTKLILVSPTNVSESSKQHGSSLVEHNVLFKHCFELSKLDKMVVKQDDIFNNPSKVLEVVTSKW